MTSKTKLFKGFNKYISSIFDEKEEEIQIGLPTDVKHVAHIGWDGPSSSTADNHAPSWMKEFKSAPLAPQQDSREEPDIQWVSEDTKSKRTQKSAAAKKDLDQSSEPPPRAKPSDKRDPSKSKQTRRQSKAGSSDSNDGITSRSLPDIPRKARRRKSRDADGSSRSRTRPGSASSLGTDTGLDTGAGAAVPTAAASKASNDHATDDE